MEILLLVLSPSLFLARQILFLVLSLVLFRARQILFPYSVVSGSVPSMSSVAIEDARSVVPTTSTSTSVGAANLDTTAIELLLRSGIDPHKHFQ